VDSRAGWLPKKSGLSLAKLRAQPPGIQITPGRTRTFDLGASRSRLAAGRGTSQGCLSTIARRNTWRPSRNTPIRLRPISLCFGRVIERKRSREMMQSRLGSSAVARCTLVGGTAFLLAAFVGNSSTADEGGVSFWLPGTFGSLAAVPGQPGWSIAGILYHTSVSASRAEAISRCGKLRLGLESDATLLLLTPG